MHVSFKLCRHPADIFEMVLFELWTLVLFLVFLREELV